MIILIDDKTDLVSLTGITGDQYKMIVDCLSKDFETYAGHWRRNGKTKTWSLVMLTWEQVIFLSVIVCNHMRMSNDVMLALEFALETLVGGKEK